VTKPIPGYLSTAEDRCDAACLATQNYPFGIANATPNGAVAILMHAASDPDCQHCNTQPGGNNFRTPEAAWLLLDKVVQAARATR
jgi:hypothetical protein